jgi:hypothetical protein
MGTRLIKQISACPSNANSESHITSAFQTSSQKRILSTRSSLPPAARLISLYANRYHVTFITHVYARERRLYSNDHHPSPPPTPPFTLHFTDEILTTPERNFIIQYLFHFHFVTLEDNITIQLARP